MATVIEERPKRAVIYYYENDKRKLNPWLPFTYAIDIMREVVGGIVWERVEHDVKRLLLFAVAALLAGLVLKGPLSPWMRVLKEKAALSGLFH
ncbi:YhgE/Pip N-terminal domain protein [Geobacillus thermoleovorans CCB_US3_UF5]|nr:MULTISPECIES: hypothetical protein [Geobacillus thermoleovorans group]AEV19244.1 YhgE/Pip N-terminal domain protein [Geobacillus thermoleovorans CCB_US3_UF5]